MNNLRIERKGALLFGVTWWLAAMVVLTSGLDAQEPASRCPATISGPEDVIEQLDRIAAGELLYGQRIVSDAIYRTISFPLEQGGTCERRGPGFDPVAVLTRVLEYGRDHQDPQIAGDVVSSAGLLGYGRVGESAWSPTDLLFNIVASGRTDRARGMALWELTQHVDDPSIRARLLAMARAPEGPPGWPELPVALAQMMGSLPSPANRPLFCMGGRIQPHAVGLPEAWTETGGVTLERAGRAGFARDVCISLGTWGSAEAGPQRPFPPGSLPSGSRRKGPVKTCAVRRSS